MFDPQSFVVGGVSLIALVFGLVEFIKSAFNLSGRVVTFIAAILGAVLLALLRLQDIIPAPYGQIFEIVVQSVAFGLAAAGFYKFAAARLPKVAK